MLIASPLLAQISLYRAAASPSREHSGFTRPSFKSWGKRGGEGRGGEGRGREERRGEGRGGQEREVKERRGKRREERRGRNL